MTRKDYKALASALQDARRGYGDINTGIVQASPEVEGVTTAAHKIAYVLAADNPKFNVERFLEACGIPEEDWNR